MLKIGILLNGGIGDVITYMPALRQLFDILQTRFELISSHNNSGNDRRLFAAAPFVESYFDGGKITQEQIFSYDLIIQLDHFITYHPQQPQLVEQYTPQILPYIELSQTRAFGFEAHRRFQPNFDRVVADYAVLKGFRRQNFFLYTGGLDPELLAPLCYIDPAQEKVITEWRLTGEKYITIHDGWDNSQFLKPGTKATKCWPDRHWQTFINQFKLSFPHIKIVQLGNQNSTAFSQVDLSLIGKIQIDEAAWLLKYSLLHIDTETGLVHLAYAMGTKSVCLTGPTKAAYYNYPDNINIFSQNCADCWWIKPNWMAQCVRDLAEPECMASLSPDAVMAACNNFLRVAA